MQLQEQFSAAWPATAAPPTPRADAVCREVADSPCDDAPAECQGSPAVLHPTIESLAAHSETPASEGAAKSKLEMSPLPKLPGMSPQMLHAALLLPERPTSLQVGGHDTGSASEAACKRSPVAEVLMQAACPACGNVYLPDALFCRKCGQERTVFKLEEPGPTAWPVPPAEDLAEEACRAEAGRQAPPDGAGVELPGDRQWPAEPSEPIQVDLV